MKTILLGNRIWNWREILQLRREQRKALRQYQPELFEIHSDIRPALEKNAADRYLHPTLFDE